MRDILTDLYNKVINFFQTEKIESENSKETAKSRLRLVLMQDRSNLEPETMAQLREELIEVISKYIVIDKEALGLNLDGDGESMALMLNIPVVRAKKPEEIREAIEEAKAKQVALIQAEQKESEEAETVQETQEDTEEESIVEFSEGSIDEICDCDCNGECACACHEKTEAENNCEEQAETTEEEASCLTFNVQANNDEQEENTQKETENNTKKNKK